MVAVLFDVITIANHDHPFAIDLSSSAETVRGGSLLPSPNLATYRVPEELDIDADADRDYFVYANFVDKL